MLASLLILAVSFALFVYWFRYSCLFLLRHSGGQAAIAPYDQFDAAEIDARLRLDSDLTPLHKLLDREYRILTYVLNHAAGFGTQSVEDRILMLDYKLMRATYWLTRTIAPAQARRALSERAAIVICLSGKLGSHAGLRLEA